MPPHSNASSGEVKLSVSYEFGRKELLFRFERSAYARAYQSKNPEGRIFADNTRDVWLPLCDSMKSLRSSDEFGMVIIFDSREERRVWLDRSVLGEDINTSDGGYGVRFRRSWSRDDIEKKLDYSSSLRDSLGVPKTDDDAQSRPGSRHRNRSPQPPRSPQYAPVDSPGSKISNGKPYYMPVDTRTSARTNDLYG